MQEVDLLIVGGGINGMGIANEAVSRGLSVMLCEQDDFASGTSSKSSKLIHGGLRYLEYYEFRLVKEALREREVLLGKAPHIANPLQFILPHHKALRPAWLLRVGLYLYDFLSGSFKNLKRSRSINLQKDKLYGAPLKSQFKKGFSYYDCWVDDARLVILNALQACEQGATVLPRHCVTHCDNHGDHWLVHYKNVNTGEKNTVKARAVVNAAGPWVDSIHQAITNTTDSQGIKLVKGSHIITSKLYEGDHAYILQNADKRIIFAIPYLDQFTLIGTTDINYQGNPATVEISQEERTYLCGLINQYFNQEITPQDILWEYAGIRPLQDNEKDPSEMSRDYKLELDQNDNQPLLLSVLGGKITTYRKLAEHALQLLEPFFPNLTPSSISNQPLPGGDFKAKDYKAYAGQLQRLYSWLPATLALRLARSYGTLCQKFIKNKNSLAELGTNFGADFYEAEARYLINEEWAQTSEDILYRRSKLGLLLSPEQKQAFNDWLKNQK